MSLYLQNILDYLFDAASFMPHGVCLAWRPDLVFLHVASDIGIFLAYATIPVALIYFLRRRKDIEYRGLFGLFAAFILACGVTHAMGALTLWYPFYGLQALLKLATAAISILTAIMIWPIIPKALALPSPTQLRLANDELSAEIDQRIAVEHELRQSRRDFEDRVLEWNAELKRSEDRFRQFAEISADWFWEQDENLRYTFVSRSGSDSADIASADHLGKTAEEAGFKLLSEDDEQTHQALLARHEPYEDVRFRRELPGGDAVYISMRARPVFDDNGIFTGYRGTGQNITQLIAAEGLIREERDRAESASRAKSEFLANVSHELRTPLHAILGFGQLLGLDSKGRPSKSRQKHVDHILSAGNHLLELIDQVLDLAKIESGKLDLTIETVQLKPISLDCLALVKAQADKRRLKFDASLDESLFVQADHVRLKQVVLNLLSNAIKYNDEGGSVALTTEAMADGFVRLKVTDTGQGIAAEQQANLFAPFQRLGRETGDIEGTGIGLAISKQLVEAMGGNIGFQSRLGEGSEFWIDIPAAPVSRAEVATTSQKPHKSKPADDITEQSKTVLYIEDNPANLDLMEAIVDTVDGLRLVSAHNAELGLAMAEETVPDLILMDINLPGMDGFAALRDLNRNDITKTIPVVAVSAAAMKNEIDKGMSAGFKHYLTKPFRVSEVVAFLKKELGSA